ncbi:hypothetical protein ACFSUD_01715 [Sulfitobacter aestuarii]|uniref:Uncharacterized protein n=1 Tax=Sulfitobacter aestuarii TaxID=2161676 RepID=A0ABW5TYN2_9RHOB
MRLLSTLFALLAPFPAAALTCMPHSLEATYQEAMAAEEIYHVVHGRLTFDPQRLPKVDLTRQQDIPPLTRLAARLEGMALAEQGFKLPFERDITLEAACYGPWCASAETGQDVLAFVRKTPEGHVLETNPCGGFLFSTPKPALLRKVQACFAGENCEPAPR